MKKERGQSLRLTGLVISEMTMPKMMGHCLAKEMISIRSDKPVILCTGFRKTEAILALPGMEVLIMLTSKFPAHHASVGDIPACDVGDPGKYWSERHRILDIHHKRGLI